MVIKFSFFDDLVCCKQATKKPLRSSTTHPETLEYEPKKNINIDPSTTSTDRVQVFGGCVQFGIVHLRVFRLADETRVAVRAQWQLGGE